MTGPRRIAYIVNQYPTISHSFIRTEIRALEQLGFDVQRLALRGWDAVLVDDADRDELARTTYLLQGHALGLLLAMVRTMLTRPLHFLRALGGAVAMARGSDRSLAHYLAYLGEACVAREQMARFGATHLHAHFGTNSTDVAWLAWRLGGPGYSFTVHGPEEFDRPRQIKLREKIADARFVVAVSSFGRSQLYRQARLEDWPKVEVVHCGLDASYLDQVPTPPPAGSRRLVSVGRLAEQKGQLALVEACRLLRDRGVQFDLVLVGDGDMRGAIETAIREHRLEREIILVGWKSGAELRDYLRGAIALVLPSFAEGLPVVIMEAMASGRPVISTYIAGIPELVRDGLEGFLVPASDAPALADAMQGMLDLDDATQREMGDRARLRVGQRHAAIDQAQRLARMIERPGALRLDKTQRRHD